jgi:tetratricopeptide (TPR) repeat protein
MPTRPLLHFTRSARNRAINLADKARDQKNPALAARLYRNITERWGADFGILVQLGNALKDSGTYDEAEKVYSSALQLNPADADCHVQFGHLMKLRGDVTRARKYYTTASHLDPRLAAARQELQALEHENATPPLPAEHVSLPSNTIYVPSCAPNFDADDLSADEQTALILTRLRSTFQWRRD